MHGQGSPSRSSTTAAAVAAARNFLSSSSSVGASTSTGGALPRVTSFNQPPPNRNSNLAGASALRSKFSVPSGPYVRHHSSSGAALLSSPPRNSHTPSVEPPHTPLGGAGAEPTISSPASASPTSSAIQAIVRSRPLFPHEMQQSNSSSWKSSYSATSVALELSESSNKVSMGTRVFEVDGVYDAPSTQEQIYARAQPLIEAVLSGRNCTIFAYGQTSAGKTYTMQGDLFEPSLHGVIPRAIDNLFASLARDASALSTGSTIDSPVPGSMQLSLSYLEIYNECIRDLLAPGENSSASGLAPSASGANTVGPHFPYTSSAHSLFPPSPAVGSSLSMAGNSHASLVQPAPFVTSTSTSSWAVGPLGSSSNLDTRETRDGAFYVPRLLRVAVKTRADAIRWLQYGLANRTVSATEMNERSSRSHTILSVYLSMAGSDTNDMFISDSNSVGVGAGIVSQLNLVDLAGSERIAARHSDTQMKETSNINKSLVCLGNVIAALSKQGIEREIHVNYRDSKLTKLLKNSIGGDSLTLLIACISPAQQNNEETLSTLRFACRAKKVQNRYVATSDPRDALIASLQREVLAMKKLLQQTLAGHPPSSLAPSNSTEESAIQSFSSLGSNRIQEVLSNPHSITPASMVAVEPAIPNAQTASAQLSAVQADILALEHARAQQGTGSGSGTGHDGQDAWSVQQKEIQLRLERLEAMVTAARAAKRYDLQKRHAQHRGTQESGGGDASFGNLIDVQNQVKGDELFDEFEDEVDDDVDHEFDEKSDIGSRSVKHGRASARELAFRATFASPHSTSAPTLPQTSPPSTSTSSASNSSSFMSRPKRVQAHPPASAAFRRPALGISSSASLLPTFAFLPQNSGHLNSASTSMLDQGIPPPLTAPAANAASFVFRTLNDEECSAAAKTQPALPARAFPLPARKLMPANLASTSLLPSAIKAMAGASAIATTKLSSTALLPTPRLATPLSSMSLMPKRPAHMMPAAVQELAAQAAGSIDLDAAYEQHQKQMQQEMQSSSTNVRPPMSLAGLLAAPLLRSPISASPSTHIAEAKSSPADHVLAAEAAEASESAASDDASSTRAVNSTRTFDQMAATTLAPASVAFTPSSATELENGNVELRSVHARLEAALAELVSERVARAAAESETQRLSVELTQAQFELKRCLDVHANELAESHAALTAFYAHVEDLQAQHDSERARASALRAERETERAAEKEAWHAQSWLEVQAARVEAEGKLEREKMAFDLQLDVLRAELADERRIVATKEVEHLEAVAKHEALLADTVMTLGVQHQASVESHAIEIDRLKAAAIEARALHEAEIAKLRLEFEAATEELVARAEEAAAALEAAEHDQRPAKSSMSEPVSAENSSCTTAGDATDTGGDLQHWRTIAEENGRELDALRAECRAKCREIDELLAAAAAAASGATESATALHTSGISPTAPVLEMRSPTTGSTTGVLASMPSTPNTPSTSALRFASERELQEAMAARDFTYSRERSSWHSRERAFLDQHAKMVADIAEVESERARELKRHRTEVDEISARLDQAVRGERSASKRATEIQQQLSACESELAAVRASTKARLVQAEQVLTQLLSANDVRETELARLRAAEDSRDGERALARAAVESRDVTIGECQRKIDELNSINARLMWERDQWRREKERAREATAAVAASMGLKMTSPPRLLDGGGEPESPANRASIGSGSGSGVGGFGGGKNTFTPLERFPSFALLPFVVATPSGTPSMSADMNASDEL